MLQLCECIFLLLLGLVEGVGQHGWQAGQFGFGEAFLQIAHGWLSRVMTRKAMIQTEYTENLGKPPVLSLKLRR